MEAPGFHKNGHGCCCGEHSKSGATVSEHSHGCSCGEHSQREARVTDYSNCCSCGEQCFHGDSARHSNSQTCTAVDYESRYYQLKMEKEEMDINYERERREREAAERNFRRELEEKSFIEEKFSSLNQSLQRYDDDLNSLRNENQFLKDQFDRMKNAINSRVSTESIGNSMHLGQEFLSSSTVTLSESVDADSYKHEVAELANENDILRQIIEIINQQSLEKASWDERLSEKYTLGQKWQTDQEEARLQEENSKLKSRIRELERSRREQKSEMEEVAFDLEDQTRKSKIDISRLEEEIHSKSLLVEDLERQLYQLRMEYQEEVQKWELKVQAEVLMKTQVQEEINVLQGTILNLEAERIDMVTKLEELYSSENVIIQARNDLEARFSVEISELQAQLEEEIRTKVELSQEMTVLMNEFVELRNKSKHMEEMYLSEIEALRFNNGMGIEGAAAENEFNTNVTTEACVRQPQQTNQFTMTGQRQSQNGGRKVRNDVQSQLNQEIQKREALEKENKELLYKMKNLLSKSDRLSGDNSNQRSGLNFSSYSSDDTDEAGGGSYHLKKKIRSLENRVAELTEESETLQRSARKGKEVEKKNRELLSELDDLSTQRDEMLRKQRTLVYEVEKSSSSLYDIMDKNRRLIDDIDSKSRKIRDMEDNFRQERNSLIRSYDREKSSEIRDIKRKKEDVEKKLDDLVRENRILENKVRDLEEEIRYLKQSSCQTQFGKRASWNNAAGSTKKGINLSNSSSQMTTDSFGIAQETVDLEQLLQERQRIEDDHLKALEKQRKQMLEEFEMEKQKLRQCFEDEKRSLANRFTAGPGQGPHIPGNIPFPGNVHVPGIDATHSSVAVQDLYYTQTGQARQPMPRNSSIMFPNVQGPQQNSFLDPNQPIRNSPHEVRNEVSSLNYQTPQQPSQLHVSFQTPQPISQQQVPYPSQYVGQGAQGIIPPPAIQGISQGSQVDNNLVMLQREVQRLNAEKTNMEKRLKNMEKRMASTSGNRGVSNDSTMFMSACDIEGNSNDKEYVDSSRSKHSDNMQGRGRSLTVAMDYSSNSNIDGRLQVTMKKLVEEHRQHSDELRKQMTLQKESFEREKIKMQREYSALLSNIKCLRKEVHILKHERESMGEKLSKQRKESQLQEERSMDEVTTVRKEYELKIRQEIEKSERTVRELQRKISISERNLKEMEIKFRDEVTQIEKKYSQERMGLEAKLRESENLVRSKLECQYQAKLNHEKEKYENTLKELRREIKCLQAQRREIQLKISKDVSDATRVNAQKDVSYNVAVQSKDFYKRFEKEAESRFAQEKRRLEDTLFDLRKEVEELKKEKSDIKSCYREEKLKREEQFEREKKRMEERHRCDIDELKRKIDMLEDDNIKLIGMQGSSGISFNRHQKITKTPYTTAIQKRNTSLELKNNELENDIIYLKERLSELESRQSKLLIFNNDKTSRAGERKVRFSSINGSKSQLRRSLSSTDLRNMAGIGYQTSYSSIPVISRDDLGISSNRLASYGSALSSGSFAAGNTAGNAGTVGDSYARNTAIAHIPSIGILNGGIGHGVAYSRDIAYGGSKSSFGLSSGNQSGIGSSSTMSGNYSSNISGGSFLGDSYASGIGSASNLLSNSGCSSGVLSGNALGIGSFSSQSTGLIGGSISGAGSGSGNGNSTFSSGNRSNGSASGFLSSNAQGLNSGNYLGTSALRSNFGSSGNNIGMQSSFSSAQRIGTGQALPGSFISGSRSSRKSGGSTGMSCGNCSSLRDV